MFLLYYHVGFGQFYIVAFCILEIFQHFKIALIAKGCCKSVFFPSPLQMLQAGFALSRKVKDFFDNADALGSTPKPRGVSSSCNTQGLGFGMSQHLGERWGPPLSSWCCSPCRSGWDTFAFSRRLLIWFTRSPRLSLDGLLLKLCK